MSKINKHSQNVEGKYYVDYDVCLICNCCVETAPNNFKLDDESIAYVFKQPISPEEEKQCEKAVHCCPVEAIGNDGLDH